MVGTTMLLFAGLLGADRGPDLLADPTGMLYPGAQVLSRGGGGTGSKEMPISSVSQMARTDDDYAKVVEYYSKRIFPEPSDHFEGRDFGKTAGGRNISGISAAGAVGGSEGRPVKMIVLSRIEPSKSTVMVVSRGEGEKWTYIHLVVNTFKVVTP